MPPLGASGAPAAANAEYREEAAFASVHDLALRHHLPPPRRGARDAAQPRLPFSLTRSEARAVARSETAHDTNSADHRLPPLDAQGHAAPGVPHMRDPGANRTQAYVPAALLAPRTSSLSVRPPARTRPPRSAVRVSPLSVLPKSRERSTRNETRFGRFADAFRPLDVRQTARSRHLTANEHWKSQIRHALYTSPRFARAEEGEDDWRVSNLDAPAPVTTTVRVYPADEPKAGPANPLRGRPERQTRARLGRGGRRRRRARAAHRGKQGRSEEVHSGIEHEGSGCRSRASGRSASGSRRAPPADALLVGPPPGARRWPASAANLAKPVARVRDDDEHAAAENENTDAAFESPSKEGSSSKEEVTSPLPRRLAVSPPADRSRRRTKTAPRPRRRAGERHAGGRPPPGSSPFGARPRRCPSGRATDADAAEPPEKRARVGKAWNRRRRRERARPRRTRAGGSPAGPCW